MAVLTVAALGVSAAAGAQDDLPIDSDPVIRTAPNLTISGSIAVASLTEWELRYTVSNRGNAAAPAFRVAVQDNGTNALIRSTAHAALDAGASRSETFRIPRTGCYLPVRFTADSTRVVLESSESDNDRVAVGLLTPDCPTQPKYQVKAVSFHANDETGIDWLGSDEPFWIFSAEGLPGTALTTASHVFGDIDTGDTAFFGSSEGCLYLSCAGGAAPNGIGVSIQAWEKDLGYVNETVADLALGFHKIGGVLDGNGGMIDWIGKAFTTMGDTVDYIDSWAADDLLGSQTFAFSRVYLATRLPAVGGSFTDTRVYSDSGEYTMTLKVTRVG
jgi:hypothetical protein